MRKLQMPLPPMTGQQRQQIVDDLIEEIAIVRRHWSPLGDMAIIPMLHELRTASRRRTRARFEKN